MRDIKTCHCKTCKRANRKVRQRAFRTTHRKCRREIKRQLREVFPEGIANLVLSTGYIG